MEGEELSEAVDSLLGVLEDVYGKARSTALYSLFGVIDRLEKEQLLKCISKMRPSLHETTQGKIEMVNKTVRINAARALARVANHLDEKLFEEVVENLLINLKEVDWNFRDCAMDGLLSKSLATRLKGKLLEDVIGGVKSALKNEESESLRKKMKDTLEKLGQ